MLGELVSGIFGMFGAKKDAAQSEKMFELQRAWDAFNIKRGRNWQIQQNKTTRKWALQDARRVRRQSVHDSAMLRKQSITDQSKYFQRTRASAEKAGFNPLAVMGMLPNAQPAAGGGAMAAGGGGASAMSMPSAPTPVLGNAFQQAAMMLGDGLGQAMNIAAENQALSEKNRQMNEAMEQITLRPKVDGIYAQRESYPSIAGATGGLDAGTATSVVDGSNPRLGFGGGADVSDRAGPALDFSRPGDTIQEEPVMKDPGYVLWRDPTTGRYVQVPSIGNEPIDVSQMPTVGWAVANDRLKEKKQWGPVLSEWTLRKFEDQSPKRYAYGSYKQRKSSTPMGYDMFGTY